MYPHLILHLVRQARFGVRLLLVNGVSDTALPVVALFFVRRAWLFFDIWILSRRLFCNLCNRCSVESVARLGC